MKNLTVLAICHMIISAVLGQDMIERMSTSICSCMDTIENIDSLQIKLDRYFPESMIIFFNSDEVSDQDYISNADTIKKTINKVMESLTYYCPKIREFILLDKEAQNYKMSDSETANQLYSAGSKALESEDYKTAKKNLIKAIKADQDWVLPYDDLGLTYKDGRL